MQTGKLKLQDVVCKINYVDTKKLLFLQPARLKIYSNLIESPATALWKTLFQLLYIIK